MANPADLSYAAQQVRLYDRHRFVAALFAPGDRREALFTLYGFNLEIAKIRDMVNEPIMGQIRLQWWRDAVLAMDQGRPCPEHPIAEPLATTIGRYRLPTALLLDMIDAREQDLAPQSPEDMAALERYGENTAGNLLQLVLHVLGAGSAAALNAGLHVGAAQALSGLMRTLPLQAVRARVFLPEDAMKAAHLVPDDVAAGRHRDLLSQVVKDVCTRAAARLRMAEEVRSAVSRKAVPGLLAAVDARRWLARLERASFDPFALSGVPDRPPLIRLVIAATTGRW